MDSGAPELALNGTLNAMSVAEALKYWPVGVGTGARDWIVDNISQGRVGPISVDANFAAGVLDGNSLPYNALTLTFPFENMTARYIAGMTPITAAKGEARLTGDSFHVSVATAAVGPLALSNGEVDTPDLHSRGVVTRITAHSEGKMSDVLRLIDEEPLGYAKRFGLNPAQVSGLAAVDLDFALPLLKDVSIDVSFASAYKPKRATLLCRLTIANWNVGWRVLPSTTPPCLRKEPRSLTASQLPSNGPRISSPPVSRLGLILRAGWTMRHAPASNFPIRNG